MFGVLGEHLVDEQEVFRALADKPHPQNDLVTEIEQSGLTHVATLNERHQELTSFSHDRVILERSFICHVKGSRLHLAQGAVKMVERVGEQDRADVLHLLHQGQREAEASLKTKHNALVLLADVLVGVFEEFLNELEEGLILLLALELL